MSDHTNPYKFYLKLSPEQLVPPLELNNEATLYLKFKKDMSALYFEIKIRHGDTVTQAQLKINGANEPSTAGALVALLVKNGVGGTTDAPTANSINGFTNHACGKIEAADLLVGEGLPLTIGALYALAKEDALQVTVFTTGNPTGELRSQVWWLH